MRIHGRSKIGGSSAVSQATACSFWIPLCNRPFFGSLDWFGLISGSQDGHLLDKCSNILSRLNHKRGGEHVPETTEPCVIGRHPCFDVKGKPKTKNQNHAAGLFDSVVQWLQLFFHFFGGCQTPKWSKPKRRVPIPFFPGSLNN